MKLSSDDFESHACTIHLRVSVSVCCRGAKLGRTKPYCSDLALRGGGLILGTSADLGPLLLSPSRHPRFAFILAAGVKNYSVAVEFLRVRLTDQATGGMRKTKKLIKMNKVLYAFAFFRNKCWG